jgi:hypothetical protein
VSLSVDIVAGNVNGRNTSGVHVTYDIVTSVETEGGMRRQYRIARRFSNFVTLEDGLAKLRGTDTSPTRGAQKVGSSSSGGGSGGGGGGGEGGGGDGSGNDTGGDFRPPPVLPTKTLAPNHSAAFIEARRQKLEEYLRAVVDQRAPNAERLIYSFLGANEISSFDNYSMDSWMQRTGASDVCMHAW